MKRMARMALLGLIWVFCIPVQGEQSQAPVVQPVQFLVEPQPMSEALNAWAQQAKLQLIWPSGMREAKQISARVVGSFTPQQALQMLLEGTGLTYSFIDRQTVAI